MAIGVLVGLCASGLPAHAGGNAYLDPPYPDLIHPRHESVSSTVPRGRGVIAADYPLDRQVLPVRSAVRALIAKQTPVKDQMSRAVCSIFSSIAMLESMMIIKGYATPDLDLSEEWLAFVNAFQSGEEGSTTDRNVRLFRIYGAARESLMPYIGESWGSLYAGELAKNRCGKTTDYVLTKCLAGHRDTRLLEASERELSTVGGPFYDPELLKARRDASRLRDEKLARLGRDTAVPTIEEAKRLLNQGIPVTLDLDFYYGAWNHRVSTELGIERNMDHWNRGIVGFPEYGSLDSVKSPTRRAGHSVVVVGYDDEVEVKTRVTMQDGSTKEFTHRGVYYFKNSWGTDSFGVSFSIGGVAYPGYGMITQDYAHSYGAFFRLPLD